MTAIARLIALPIVSAGIMCGSALGLAGLASATPATPPAPSTTTAPAPVGPGYQYAPGTYATPAPSQTPGWQGHHGPNHLH